MVDLQKGDLLSTMLSLVVAAFNGIFDKGRQPYVLHLLKVMHYTESEDEVIQCIALGHHYMDIFNGDVIAGVNDLRQHGFPERIIAGIVALTKVPGESYEAYKAKVKANPDAVIVKMADLRHDTDLRRLKGTPVTQEDIERIVKHHEFYNELEKVSKQNMG